MDKKEKALKWKGYYKIACEGVKKVKAIDEFFSTKETRKALKKAERRKEIYRKIYTKIYKEAYK